MAEPQPVRLAVACVAPADLHPEVDPLSGEVTVDERALALTASDAAAVEHVLRLSEALGLAPLVAAAGGEPVDGVLGELAGLGCRVLRVAWPAPGTPAGAAPEELVPDEAELARAVAAAVAAEGELAVACCGDRSSDRGTGAFPAFLADELGAAQALGLVELEADPAGRGLRGVRRLEGGRRERLAVPLPAVCSVEAAGTRLRRASLAGVLEASGRPVPVWRAPGPPRPRGVRVRGARPFVARARVVPAPAGTAHDRLVALTGALDTREPPTVAGPLEAAEAADLLLGYLERNGFALPGPADEEDGTRG